MKNNLHIGVGAKLSFLKHLLHPNKVIKNKYTNIDHNEFLGDLFFKIKVVKAIKSRDTNMIFLHNYFPKETLYVAVHLCKVEREVPATELFGGVASPQEHKEYINGESEYK